MVATLQVSALSRKRSVLAMASKRPTARRSAVTPRSRRPSVRFFEFLEDRTLLSTLYVTAPSIPTDATHFQTLQDALAVVNPGDTIDLQPGFSAGTVLTALSMNTPIILTSEPGAIIPYNLRIQAGGTTLTGLTMAPGTTLFLDGSNTTIGSCTLPRVIIDSGSGGNIFTGDTIAGLSTIGGGDANGHDVFNNNTFTGKVAITGNDSADTDDSFSANTFTVAANSALDLEHASGTVVQNNTFTDTLASANAVMVHNSGNVQIVGNTIIATGGQAHGIYVSSDGSSATAADIRDNAITTTDGVAIYFSKMSTSATLEVRVQGNNLQGNAIGVYAFGDGASVGNIDLGGGATQFGASSGGNDFSSFTESDDSHFAIGLIATSADNVVHADANTWGVSDPLSVVADLTHTLDASGSGQVTAASPTIVLPTPPNPDPAPTPTETIVETTRDRTVVQGSHTRGPIAHFTDSATHQPGDFTVTITWSDGSTSQGLVLRDRDGYDVFAPRTWNTTGSFSYTVSVASSTGATASAQGTISVIPRALSATGVNGTVIAGVNFCGTVATFTDNLRAGPCDYAVTIAWSDGATSRGMIVRDRNGDSCIKVCRRFTTPGTVSGIVNITTRDGLFTVTAGFTLTINPPPPPPTPANHGRHFGNSKNRH